MKGIKDLDFRRFRTQGIVDAGVIIPMSTNRSRRRPDSRRFQMDRFLATLPPACPRTQPRLPRQVLRATP